MTIPHHATAPVRPDRRVLHVTIALAAVSLSGAVMSVTGGLSATVLDAMGPSARLSIPVPMMLAQLLVAAVASGSRRRPALVAAVLLAIVEPICIVSGFFDGGYFDAALTAWQRVAQLVLVAMLAVVALVSARRARRLRRGAVASRPVTRSIPESGRRGAVRVP